jgi:hypothetical protein
VSRKQDMYMKSSPRTKVEEQKAMLTSMRPGTDFPSPLDAIRLNCGLCPNRDGATSICGVPTCFFFPYRFGQSPEAARAEGRIVDLELLTYRPGTKPDWGDASLRRDCCSRVPSTRADGFEGPMQKLYIAHSTVDAFPARGASWDGVRLTWYCHERNVPVVPYSSAIRGLSPAMA